MDISRRGFLRSAALASGMLAAHRDAASQAPPSSAPPAAAGRVVLAHNPLVWQKGRLSGDALKEMLDASVVALTREPDARRAWAAICKPSDRVAIKVNAVVRGSTHAPLALAVAERLQAAGVRPDRIVIYDRMSSELRDAGFSVAESGERVRCYGVEGDHTGSWMVAGSRVRLARVLAECDALINIPVLKAFSIGGLSFGMKNHYGSFNLPQQFHGSAFTRGVVDLNALDPIRARTRLIVGDVLTPEFRVDSTDYVLIGGQATVVVGTDPIALDRVGLQMATQLLTRVGRDTHPVERWATEWLSEGQKRGLGIGDVDRILVDRVRL